MDAVLLAIVSSVTWRLCVSARTLDKELLFNLANLAIFLSCFETRIFFNFKSSIHLGQHGSGSR
jgi:uncharacterized membrane protein YwaF